MPRSQQILSYENALKVILDAVSPGEATTVGVRQSLGRVLESDIAAARPMPDLPRSAVDGFAVQAHGGPQFTVTQEVRAGILPEHALPPGEAAAIMTGAVVPDGADCVVMLEDCQIEDHQIEDCPIEDRPIEDRHQNGQQLNHPRITVPENLKPGDLINPAGDEIQADDIFATQGTIISSAVYPALFCAGVSQVPVYCQPRVGLLVSGDEVREIEDGPAPGQVFNTNRYIIEAICAGLGISIVATEAVVDDETATRKLLTKLDEECDIIITSGGVSKGRYDHLGAILRSDSFDLLVGGTAIKPGRPLHVARSSRGTLVFGMPGYPSALLTNAFLYLIPALKKAAGRTDFATRWFSVQLAESMKYRPGKAYFNRVRFEHQDARWLAHDPGSQMSSHFVNFARCHGLVRMPTNSPEEQGGKTNPTTAGTSQAITLNKGTVVQALDFGWELS